MSENTISNQEFQIPKTDKGESVPVGSKEIPSTPEDISNNIVDIEGLRRIAKACDQLSNVQNNETDKVRNKESTLASFIGCSLISAREDKIKRAA